MNTTAWLHAGGVRRGRVLALATVLTLGAWTKAFADDPLCIGSILSQAPDVNGEIANDQGWANSGQYAFNNGTTQPDAVIHMTRDGTRLYFAFEVNNDPEYNEKDVIIILLGPTANAAQDRRIHIYPVSNSGNGTNSPPHSVKVWIDSNAWPANAGSPDATNPPWMLVRVTAAAAGPTGPFSYRVEASIDLAASGITLPAGATPFKLHFNILRLYTFTDPVTSITETRVAGQLNWPEAATVPGVPSNPTDSQLFSSPPRAGWGDAIQNSFSPCQGVRVTGTWINAPGNTSTLNPPPMGGSITNNYFVQIQNTGTAPAGHVLASIHAWRFGITPYVTFGKVPSTPNPVSSFAANPAAISPGDTRTLPASAWTISRADFDAQFASSRTICSLVQLDVDNANTAGVARTLIANRYYYWNTHFAPASRFAHSAVLDTRGFAAPADGSGRNSFDLLVSDRQFAGSGDGGQDSGVVVREPTGGVREPRGKVSSARVPFGELVQVGGMQVYERGARFFSRAVCGFRRTGRFISIDGTRAEVMERTPCYGYWVYHLGDMRSWRYDLTAQGLEQVRERPMYTISVPVNGSVELATVIEATEGFTLTSPAGWPWWMWLLLALLILVLLLLWLRRRRNP